MLKRLRCGQTCCFGELSLRDKFTLKKKCLKLTNIVQNFNVFDDFDAISVNFWRDFVLSSNTINSTATERAMHYIV